MLEWRVKGHEGVEPPFVQLVLSSPLGSHRAAVADFDGVWGGGGGGGMRLSFSGPKLSFF